MTDQFAIDVHHLNKSFAGKPAVKNLSLQVTRGEIFGFLGPNGSGKTTTIRMLCGLMTPDSGTGQCLGYDILTQAKRIKPLVGYVPQHFSLYKDLTVFENLLFIARVYQEDEARARVDTTLRDLELQPYQNHLAGSLSGGWQQRLSLAAAIIHHPQLLLLDEPTAGVDPEARREFWNYITQLAGKGITSLVSTHYMDEAERCNRLAYIMYGHLVIEGTVSSIIKQAHLVTWAAQGSDLTALAERIQSYPGVEQVIAWGNELRICGDNEQALQETVQQFSQYHWHIVNTNLEEVFIHLVNQHQLNQEAT